MRFVLASLLCVGLCGSVVACDEPGELPQIEVVAAAAVDAAMANVNTVAQELVALGQPAAMAAYSLAEENIGSYVKLGVSADEATRLAEIGLELGELLNTAGPLFSRGDATVRYGVMLGEAASGKLAQQFEAAAFICKGADLMEQARKPLEATAVLLEEAQTIIDQYQDDPETDLDA